jgi:hypothetical protein
MRMKIEFRLQCVVRHDDRTGLFLSSCPSLDLHSQGTTAEQARAAIEDGLAMFLRACLRRGILEEALERRGFTIDATSAESLIPPRSPADGEFVDVSPDDTIWDARVPLYMMPNASRTNAVCLS